MMDDLARRVNATRKVRRGDDFVEDVTPLPPHRPLRPLPKETVMVYGFSQLTLTVARCLARTFLAT